MFYSYFQRPPRERWGFTIYTAWSPFELRWRGKIERTLYITGKITAYVVIATVVSALLLGAGYGIGFCIAWHDHALHEKYCASSLCQ